MKRHLLRSPFLLFSLVLFALTTSPPIEAGLLSTLSKLGKSAKEVDSPNIDIPIATRFADEIATHPEGSVAEVSYRHGQWQAKAVDGSNTSLTEFNEQLRQQGLSPTLVISENDLPNGLAAFDSLPKATTIHIHARNKQRYQLQKQSSTYQLHYQNIRLSIDDIGSLKSALWQLQRPVAAQQIRFVQLATQANVPLAEQVVASKAAIDVVGIDKLADAISNMRQQTMVLAGKIENGFLIQANQKVTIASLEKSAISHDVNLVILGTDSPKISLNKLIKGSQPTKLNSPTSMNTVADFYNRFSSTNQQHPIQLSLQAAGEFHTAIQLMNRVRTTQPDIAMNLLPLHFLVETIKLVQPNEQRAKELSLRIHPAIPSAIQFYLIMSIVIGLTTFKTSWMLYQKMWLKPNRFHYKSRFIFYCMALLNRLVFIVCYLPTLAIYSPIYLICRWTYLLINFIFIRPSRWLVNRLS